MPDLSTKTTVVHYDDRLVRLEQILEATNEAGFPSKVIGGGL